MFTFFSLYLTNAGEYSFGKALVQTMKNRKISTSKKWLSLCFYLPISILLLEYLVGIFRFRKQSEFQGLTFDQAFLINATGHTGLTKAKQPYRKRPLQELTLDKTKYSTTLCDPDLVYIFDTEFPSSHASNDRKIPRIVHQTSRSRCLTPNLAKTTQQWQWDGWSYYFHDDDALWRLFEQEFPNFPLLETIARKCILHGTLKADLWRYLVLWVYGGLYADLDSVPNKLSPNSIRPSDDAFFVVEQYHLLSQYFMATSPRHPLMWYAFQQALANLWMAPDTGSINAAFITGPHSLHAAFVFFRKDVGVAIEPAKPGFKPVRSGHFLGTWNRSVTVIGVGENQNEYVDRDVIRLKRREYSRLGMRHFQDDVKRASGESCLRGILSLYEEATGASLGFF